MSNSAQNLQIANVVDPKSAARLDVFGPTIQILTPLTGEQDAPCIMRGMIPPDGIVPLHSHVDPEIFVLMSGELEGLSQRADGFVWIPVRPGDVFYVPSSVKHAFRNRWREPAICTIVSTVKLGRFFDSIGIPVPTGAEPVAPPSPERIRRFLETADAFGYWNAGPDENARLGLNLAPVAESSRP
jgi:quercetin dioxygenase-like cupin family protein